MRLNSVVIINFVPKKIKVLRVVAIVKKSGGQFLGCFIRLYSDFIDMLAFEQGTDSTPLGRTLIIKVFNEASRNIGLSKSRNLLCIRLA